MRLLFFQTPGCPFCWHWKWALHKLATIQPIGNIVSWVDMRGDPKGNLLEHISNFEYPTIAVLDRVREKKYKSSRLRHKVQYVLHGTSTHKFNESYINRLLKPLT